MRDRAKPQPFTAVNFMAVNSGKSSPRDSDHEERCGRMRAEHTTSGNQDAYRGFARMDADGTETRKEITTEEGNTEDDSMSGFSSSVILCVHCGYGFDPRSSALILGKTDLFRLSSTKEAGLLAQARRVVPCFPFSPRSSP